MNNIDKIIITADPLRIIYPPPPTPLQHQLLESSSIPLPIHDGILNKFNSLSPRKLEWFHRVRAQKYYLFLNNILAPISSIPVQPFSISTMYEFDGCFSQKRFYELCGIDLRDPTDWLKIFDLTSIPHEAENYYINFVKDSLVICHELPNTLKKIHDKYDLPYIDISVHPVRFLEDNLWGFSSNNQLLLSRIKGFLIEKEFIFKAANFLKVQNITWDNFQENNKIILFTGQTELDKSLFENGKLKTLSDYRDILIKLLPSFDKILLKHHPFSSENHRKEQFNFLKSLGLEVIETNENFYKLCCNDNINTILSLSSSTLEEGEFFGKETIRLIKPQQSFIYKDSQDSTTTSNILSVHKHFFLPSFWKTIISSLGENLVTNNTSFNDFHFYPKNNELRTLFGDYWAYPEIDSSALISKKFLETKFDSQDNELHKLHNFCLSNYGEIAKIWANQHDIQTNIWKSIKELQEFCWPK